MINYQFTGIIEYSTDQFKFGPGQRELFNKYSKHLRVNGGGKDADGKGIMASISLQIPKVLRNKKQNGLYWLRCTVLGLDQGDTKDEIHKLCMEMAGYGEHKTRCGITKFYPISSTTLSVKEFSYLMEMQDQIAFELNENREEREWLILPTKENMT